MAKNDYYGFLRNEGAKAVISISVELLGTPDRPGYDDSYDEKEGEKDDLQPKIACEVVIRRVDGFTTREGGCYMGKIEVDEETGTFVADDPEGHVIIAASGIACRTNGQMINGGYSYTGPIVRGTMTGSEASIIRVTPKGEVDDDCCAEPVYEGEVENGLPHGYGKLNDKYEGYFENGNRIRLLQQQDQDGEGFPCVLLFFPRNLVAMVTLSKVPVCGEYERFQLDDVDLNKAKPLFSELRARGCSSISRTGVPFVETIPETSYFIYGKDGVNVVGRLAVNYHLLNMVLAGNLENLENLDNFVAIWNRNDYLLGAAFGRDPNNPDGFKMPPFRLIFDRPNSSTDVLDAQLGLFEQVRRKLLETMRRDFAIRSGRTEDKHFSGGCTEEYGALVLTLAENVKELKRVRFTTGLIIISPRNVTSFLESMAIDRDTLLVIEEDYVATAASIGSNLFTSGHAIALILDLKKIRKIMTEPSSGWETLNSTDEVLFYIFDSSAIIGNGTFSKEYENILEGIKRNSRRININIQKTGSCWLYAVAAVLTAIKNPQLVARLVSGEIELQKLSHVARPSLTVNLQSSKFLNIFVTETLLTLQRIGNTYDVGLTQGRLLLGRVVDDSFVTLVINHFNGGNLLNLLEMRKNMMLFAENKKFSKSPIGDVTNEHGRILQKDMSSATSLVDKLLAKELIDEPLVDPNNALRRDVEFVDSLEKFKRLDGRLVSMGGEVKVSHPRARRVCGKPSRNTKLLGNQKSGLSLSSPSSSSSGSRIQDGFEQNTSRGQLPEENLTDEDSNKEDYIPTASNRDEVSDKEEEFNLLDNIKRKHPRLASGTGSSFSSIEKNKRLRLDQETVEEYFSV
ncbi:MAG: MORN repeat-containing protein [Rickettsiales bacterium]|jgi:hypothetical protein|nr:MORN repeat-containing protein [Rickettsiales bacterium]